MLQWKARLLASLATFALLAAALVGGYGERLLHYLDW
jgi:nitrate reductase NapE component